MKNWLKRIALKIAFLLNLHRCWHTPPEAIRELVQLLVPMNLGIPLRRIGGHADGGYLIPDDLQGIRYCFSPGVADEASFEKGLSDLGIDSFMADRSVERPPIEGPNFNFLPRHLGPVTDAKTITLDDWVEQKCPSPVENDLILQMDIEGAEYLTLLSTSPSTLGRFRIIALEIHNLGHLNHPLFFHLVDAVIRKLLKQFEVAHIHPNNSSGVVPLANLNIPRVLEVTLLRKDRVLGHSPVCLPHKLDEPNIPSKPEIQLSQAWWCKGES